MSSMSKRNILKVEVAGAPVSMPWQKVDTMDGASLVSVHREGDWTILKSYIGVEVKCNSKRNVCEIKLPGRMHARSSGLLGCNDNEPANDLDLVDGTNNHQVCCGCMLQISSFNQV
ncbi:unnamed protein product [Toxocara canis]|uniref:VWFD domain-containing protein n=1 Tax=Toxocara canis TaxID=6265 RepID=A0A183U8A1_TOXCA|nr:unnamed protein product [Toxocara canis]